MQCTVAVIGGGITGLAAAHRLQGPCPGDAVRLLEGSGRLGGLLQTSHVDGFLIEAAADGFLVNPPAAVELCRQAGLGDALISPNESGRQAMVVRLGRLQPIPAGFTIMAPSRMGPLLRTPVLSIRGKLRAGLEYCIPRRTGEDDESLAAFVRRRFGRELLDRLVQPLISGIYTGDLERLSLAATLPRLRQMEQEHGSLLRAMFAQRRKAPADTSRGARYGQFATLRGGMSTLVDAVARRLPPAVVQCDSPVVRLAMTADRQWKITIGGPRPRRLTARAIVLATPTYQAADLLAEVNPALAAELRAVEYASCAIATLGYRASQFEQRPDSFGFVVPLVEQRSILSCSFASLKYPGRAPADALLLRVFLGGACQSELLQLSGDELLAIAHREVAALLSIRGEPMLAKLARHWRAMPQYHVGHCERVKRIEHLASSLPNLALAGSAFHGVGAPACIRDGELAAERVSARLRPGVDHPSLVSQ